MNTNIDPNNPPRHKFWGAGEPGCPADLKASNGELHTMRCKVCGDGWRKSIDVCFGAATEGEQPSVEGSALVSITVGGSTHTRTADEWLALARADLRASRLAGQGEQTAPAPTHIPDSTREAVKAVSKLLRARDDFWQAQIAAERSAA